MKENNKEKTCFVIMPISDCDNYPNGHFRRVYEHLIKPACERAGFKAQRADDVNKTNVIMVEILQSIIHSDMVICDLSSKNPNVLYELGIRQSFKLPVTLIKDSKTSRIFDIQGLRDTEYDESLRVDTVEDKIVELADIIKNTYESKNSDIKSLIDILKVKPAEMPSDVKISPETSLILEQLKAMNTKINELQSKVESKSIIYPGLSVGVPIVTGSNWSNAFESSGTTSYVKLQDDFSNDVITNTPNTISKK